MSENLKSLVVAKNGPVFVVTIVYSQEHYQIEDSKSILLFMTDINGKD